MISADVAVVGAGPAGTAAAVAAARSGLRVVVVDRASFPRDKCCGDGLTTGALRRLDALGLRPKDLPSFEPVRLARVRVPDGRQTELAVPADAGVYAATARRVELDAALVDLARRHGAVVHEGRAALHVRGLGVSGVEVELDDGESVRACYVVAADGMWSPLRKALGVGDAGYLGEWHALRQYFHQTSAEARSLWVWFEDDLRPGYAWSFPLPGDRVNVGFGIRRRPGQAAGQMKAQWQELLARPHIARVLGAAASPEGPVKTWPIPARIGSTRLATLGGRVLFAGDAARAADTMTGEGIAQALETGELAASCAVAWGPDEPARAAGAYRAAIRRGMAIDDLVSAVFSRVLASRRGARAWFEVANATDATRRHFAHWMFEDYPRAAPVTPWRWRPGLLHQPGAFASGT